MLRSRKARGKEKHVVKENHFFVPSYLVFHARVSSLPLWFWPARNAPCSRKASYFAGYVIFLSEKGNERIREKLLSGWWRAKARASSLRQSFGRIIKASVGMTLFS